jgi:hypothetical protein
LPKLNGCALVSSDRNLRCVIKNLAVMLSNWKSCFGSARSPLPAALVRRCIRHSAPLALHREHAEAECGARAGPGLQFWEAHGKLESPKWRPRPRRRSKGSYRTAGQPTEIELDADKARVLLDRGALVPRRLRDLDIVERSDSAIAAERTIRNARS